MACRKHSPGNPCCACQGVCTGTPNAISTIEWSIGGSHSQSVSRNIRNLKASSLFDTDCLKVSCASPDTSIGSAGPVSITSNSALKDDTCCASVGFVTALGEGASSPVYNSRDNSFTVTRNLSGTTANLCPPGGTLPWEINSDFYFRRYSTLVAKRIVDSVHLRFCPTTDSYSVAKWTVTADVCWRVVYRLKQTVEQTLDTDAWSQKTQFSIFPFPGSCTDATVKKYCSTACTSEMGTGEPVTYGSGSADLTSSCELSFAESSLDTTPLTTIGEPCSNSNADTDLVIDQTSVYAGKQKRIITIDRTCELPATLTFPYASLSGANGDTNISWADPGYTASCEYNNTPRVHSGDRSSFTVYSAMAESWTITLS